MIKVVDQDMEYGKFTHLLTYDLLELAQDKEFTANDYRVLLYLLSSNGCALNYNDLAAQLGIGTSTVYRTLDKLTKKKLIAMNNGDIYICTHPFIIDGNVVREVRKDLTKEEFYLWNEKKKDKERKIDLTKVKRKSMNQLYDELFGE
jgi:sugar-specific transcriptional regulator TrmB